jgi:hypothetical protein
LSEMVFGQKLDSAALAYGAALSAAAAATTTPEEASEPPAESADAPPPPPAERAGGMGAAELAACVRAEEAMQRADEAQRASGEVRGE